MCGIAGIHALGDTPIEMDRLVAMRDDQTHRGPDATGLFTGPRVGLACNRLAVIDLSVASNQPMLNDDESAALVFNGEIYNFQDLRRELLAQGCQFRSRGDTEVILRGYETWGTELFSRLNGMFALAIWDGSKRQLVLARDRVGKKPLFYAESGGELVFASEVRALVKGLRTTPAVDDESLDLYLTYLSVPGDRSIFKGVRKLPPGSVLLHDAKGTRIDRYWRISYRDKLPRTEPEALEQLDVLLTDATRIRMISDVPLGAFLSGGVDSSTVVALMRRNAAEVRTFTVAFTDEQLNESAFARTVATALDTRHQELVLHPDAAAVLPTLVWHYGEPFADSAAVPTYYISAAARREVTVVLNGDGGDEAFAGYPWLRAIRLASFYRAGCPSTVRRWLAGPARRVAAAPGWPSPLHAAARFADRWGGRSAQDAFWIWPGIDAAGRDSSYAPAFRARLGQFNPRNYALQAWKSADGADDLDRALQVGVETYLPDDLLVKVDVASMAHSLEARSPFLDHRVLEFAARLMPSLLMKGLSTKHLLKTYAARRVPSSVIYRRKQGFAIPVAEWFRGPLRRPFEALIKSPRFAAREILDPQGALRLLERHVAGENLEPRLWSILCLEIWFRMFVDGDVHRGDSLNDLG